MTYEIDREDKALFVRRINDALVECGAGRYDDLIADPLVYEALDDGCEVVSRRGCWRACNVSCDSLTALMADVHSHELA